MEEKANHRRELDLCLVLWRMIAERLSHDGSLSKFAVQYGVVCCCTTGIKSVKGENRRWSVRLDFSRTLVAFLTRARLSH